MPEHLRPWFEMVRLHPDVESGRLAMATFAIDFGGVLANSEDVPLVYRDSHAFSQATHLTSGIRRLLEEVLEEKGYWTEKGTVLFFKNTCWLLDVSLLVLKEKEIR